MDEIVFSSQDELYKRIQPALRSKKKLLSKDGFKSIEIPEIWNYMRNVKWSNKFGLELCDMVDDILNTSNVDISEYCLKERRKKSTLEMSLPKLK